ncbi:uncharacterized protein LOC126740632 [Anthonomus grandis grandis]|uniref:uncharacterized protein LOC126740632 n=1 Tax=Anthonomus grandis grandis TaxID=2921223 RepID=UPI0021667407|nr:uncharacterized protein LOC126740632 [Anthonomus grandis grandis]XP_050302692.1 uncharacterized protein LOC126740632 [Anthonomus grandis grandis]XP_050302694.1 uncharacterized protein LOC126740632 [Anthonomus grandis grandis]
MWWNILVSLLLLPNFALLQKDCSTDEHDRCVRIADPLVKEAHLVFPDNLNDIDLVCRTWNKLVDCLKTYTEHCFTDQERRQFNRAVESPIESVHQMCMQPGYQKEYLQYAPCIKNTMIKRIHCGTHYNLLVDQVEQGDIISKSTLCCSHERFRQCVLKETKRLCDRGISDGQATRFASQFIDKAFKFLQDQCINYIPNSGDCVASDTQTSYSDRSEPSSASPSSSEVYPWSTIKHEAKELSASRIPKLSTSSSWLPSSTTTRADPENNAISGSIFPTQHLGTRSRPASYGRASSWFPDALLSTTLSSNTLPNFPSLSSTPGSIREHTFSTAMSYDINAGYNNKVEEKSVSASPPFRPTDHSSTDATSYIYSTLPEPDTWYPAAGNQLNNDVDEPNQLGLRKPKNNSCRSRVDILRVMTFSVVIGWLLRTI